MRLQDRVSLITGAAAGIGKAIVERFASEGAIIIAADLDLPAVASLAERLKKNGIKAMAAGVNVSDSQAVERLGKKIVNEFGRIDVLVNNAGIRNDNQVRKSSSQDWQAVIDTNLSGCFNCCKTAQKYMADRKYGKIVNVAGTFPPALVENGTASYCAANSGIEGLTRSLALELGRYNITINCVAPDYIDTEMMRRAARKAGMYLDDFREFSRVQIALGHLGTPADVADAVLFFASDESKFVSGQVLSVRGGP